MAGTLYVKPADETTSCPECGQDIAPRWQLLDEPDGTPLDEFDTRSEAQQAAIDNRTDEAVLLLRADGSTHSEMVAAVASGEPGQAVDADAVTEG